MKVRLIVLIAMVVALTACGGGGGGGGGDNSNTDTNNPPPPPPVQVQKLSYVTTYEIPYGGYSYDNYLFDQDKVIFVGGEAGLINSGTAWGHPAFSDKLYVLNLSYGTIDDYSVAGFSADPFTVGTRYTGLGKYAHLKKYSNNKYFIHGGFQYQDNTLFLDLNQSVPTVETFSVNTPQLTDSIGNPFYFYPNNEANAILTSGDVFFFGARNAPSKIIYFDSSTRVYKVSNAELSPPRYNIDAYKLNDERVLLVGGYDEQHNGTTYSTAEIYDPATDSLQRVADFPEPKATGQHRSSVDRVTDDAVCVSGAFSDFKYIISQNTWVSGCDIPVPERSELRPEGTGWTYAEYLGTMSNGNMVFIEGNATVLGYSQELDCYPFAFPTKIHVFSVDWVDLDSTL